MKLVQLIAFLVILSVASIAQSKTFNRTVDFTAGGDLRVSTDVGSVRLTSWERNQVEVVARIEGAINGGGPRLTLHTDRTQVFLKNN